MKLLIIFFLWGILCIPIANSQDLIQKYAGIAKDCFRKDTDFRVFLSKDGTLSIIVHWDKSQTIYVSWKDLTNPNSQVVHRALIYDEKKNVYPHVLGKVPDGLSDEAQLILAVEGIEFILTEVGCLDSKRKKM